MVKQRGDSETNMEGRGQAGAITVVQVEKLQKWPRMKQTGMDRHRGSTASQEQAGVGAGFIMCYFPNSILSV